MAVAWTKNSIDESGEADRDSYDQPVSKFAVDRFSLVIYAVLGVFLIGAVCFGAGVAYIAQVAKSAVDSCCH